MYLSIKSNQVDMIFDYCGMGVASNDDINRAIKLIIDVVGNKMWPKP